MIIYLARKAKTDNYYVTSWYYGRLWQLLTLEDAIRHGGTWESKEALYRTFDLKARDDDMDPPNDYVVERYELTLKLLGFHYSAIEG